MPEPKKQIPATPAPTTPAPATPPPATSTLRKDVEKLFGVAGKVALSTFEKGGNGVRFYADKNGQPVAEVTTDKDTFEIMGKKFKREDIKKTIDKER